MCLIKYYRNISISAHIDAGKTTTTERILYYTGKKHKIGEVHDGEATMDWMIQERERGITITSACTTVFWKDMLNKYPLHRINIIDTPGHVDFTIEVERSMRVIDAVCMIYCSVAGIQSQSETVWRQANKYKISRLIFVNKMDRLGADFFKIYDDLKIKLNANPIILFIPYIINDNFLGIIDLLKFKLIIWDDFSKGMKYFYHEIPEDFLKISQFWKEKIIDITLEDDYLANKYLNNLFISELSLIKFLRKKTIDGVIQPMLCGSSFKNKGVQCLLDAIVNFLPSPLDFVDIKGFSTSGEQISRKVSKNEKFSALAFKIMSDPFVGQLVFFRVYSGVLKCNDFILNSTKLKRERIGRILHIYANNREDVKSVSAGDIAAAVGLKTVTTGDTLCDIKNPIIFEKIFFPEPVISQSIELKNKTDQEKIIFVLNKLMREDPSFTSHVDIDSNQTIISGMGELHLEILVDRIKREFDLELIVGKPKVSYKETIKSSAFNIEGKYIRQSGGRGQYGHVVISVEPNLKGHGYKFLDEIKGGVIPKEYITVIDKSIKNTLSNGILLGYPVLDIIVHLINGSYHEVDSSENAFKIAASLAIKSAVKKANPILLEPLMSVTIEIPEFYLGVIIGDISSKRGFLEGIEDSNDGLKILKSIIPLSEMFGYSTNLRSLSQGRGIFNMVFKEYREVPKNIFDSMI